MDLNLLIANLTQIRDNLNCRGKVSFVSDGEDYLCLLVNPISHGVLKEEQLIGLTPAITNLSFTKEHIELQISSE